MKIFSQKSCDAVPITGRNYVYTKSVYSTVKPFETYCVQLMNMYECCKIDGFYIN